MGCEQEREGWCRFEGGPREVGIGVGRVLSSGRAHTGTGFLSSQGLQPLPAWGPHRPAQSAQTSWESQAALSQGRPQTPRS